MATVYIDNIDIQTEFTGLYVSSVPDVLFHAQVTTGVVESAAGAGVLASGAPTVGAKDVTINVVVFGADVDSARQVFRNLQSYAGSGMRAIRLVDRADIMIYARLRSVEPVALPPEMLSTAIAGRMVFTAEHPYWRETSVGSYGFDDEYHQLLMGNAPTPPTYEIWGPCDTPTLTVAHANGMIWRESTFNINLTTSNDFLRIVTSVDAMAIYKSLSGTVTLDNTLLEATAPSRFPQALDPFRLGNPYTGHHPLAKVTALSGTPYGVAYYPRQFM